MTPEQTVAYQLGELRGTMEEGFKAITSRMDVANGRTAKNEESIASLKSELNGLYAGFSRHLGEDRKKADERSKWLDPVRKTAVTVVIVLVLWILVRTNVINPDFTQLLYP